MVQPEASDNRKYGPNGGVALVYLPRNMSSLLLTVRETPHWFDLPSGTGGHI